MKKTQIITGCIVFILCFAFMLSGVSSLSIIRPIFGSFKRTLTGEYSIEEAKQVISDTLTGDLLYHDLLLNIDSIKNYITGTKIITKDDCTIVRSESGKLIEPINKLSENEIKKGVEKIKQLQICSEENGAEFLYCVAPNKSEYEIAPSNINNFSKENTEMFIKFLSDANISYVSFSEYFKKNKIKTDDLYYYTDHHWKAETGFKITGVICEELHRLYGFEYNTEYIKEENYNFKIYPNHLLGSYGRKTGKYFTLHGKDDFALITPKFKTNMTEEEPLENIVRTGAFEETVLFIDDIENVSYGTYSGGNFRLQITKNNLNTDGKKILIIRDSFADVVTPFLSLQTKELHICDERKEEWIDDPNINLMEYIKNNKPDFVLILFNGVPSENDSRLNFFESN